MITTSAIKALRDKREDALASEPLEKPHGHYDGCGRDLCWSYRSSLKKEPFPQIPSGLSHYHDECNCHSCDDVRAILEKRREWCARKNEEDARDGPQIPEPYRSLIATAEIAVSRRSAVASAAIKSILTDEQFRGYCIGNMLRYQLQDNPGNEEADRAKAKEYLELMS